MATIDYEKKYKEALEKARQLCAYPTTNPFISDLQDLFPELAESEDERIRKGLIEACKKSIIVGGFHKDKVIAWLENQGEQNTDNSIWHKVEPKEYVLEKTLICKENGEIDLVEDTILSVTGAKYALPVSFLGIPKSLEKQGEMKEIIPEDATVDSNEDGLIAETIRYKNEKQGEQPKKHDVCDNCDQQGSCVSPCPMKLVEKQGEQKLNPVLDIEIPFGAKDSELQETSYYIPEGFYAEIEGNRVVIKKGEQKPTEWSEEDEKMLDKMRDYFMRFLGDKPDFTDDKRYEGFVEFIDHRLKSLRPQKHWKPSEEQMKELKKYCPDNMPLTALYEQLKKLIEG